METVRENADLLLIGLRNTLQLSLLIIIFGTIIGFFGGLALLYGPTPLRKLLGFATSPNSLSPIRGVMRGYVDIVRGLPLLVLIFLLFYGFPAANIDVSGYQAAVLAFSLFAGAHISEIVRGAVAAVPFGQTDAAKSLGLTFWPRTFAVILPQALPIALPPWVNTAVETVKGTSLVVLVSVNDLMFATVKIAERTGDPMPLYLTAAAIYIVVNLAISRFGAWLERRLSYGAVA